MAKTKSSIADLKLFAIVCINDGTIGLWDHEQNEVRVGDDIQWAPMLVGEKAAREELHHIPRGINATLHSLSLTPLPE